MSVHNTIHINSHNFTERSNINNILGWSVVCGLYVFGHESRRRRHDLQGRLGLQMFMISTDPIITQSPPTPPTACPKFCLNPEQ